MGSKRFMLNNGLGELIRDNLSDANRVVDLFCGSGSVVYFVAANSNKKIIAADLQKYATVLSSAVIGRTKSIDPKILEDTWLLPTVNRYKKSKLYLDALNVEKKYSKNIKLWVSKSRELCTVPSKKGPIWNAYGGYYYSPKQSIILDYLIDNLPKDSEFENVCRAAIIIAAARCAASPGHTAQPFQPTNTAAKFIKIAWEMDIIRACKVAIREIAPLYAKTKGQTFISNALDLVPTLKKNDLVIIDPPYSGVQYSRFYHVLETIARGECGAVEGVGRYPSLLERPQSAFSNSGQALRALEDLMCELAKKETIVIFTFPKGDCSNGLSGDIITKVVKKWFVIDEKRVHGHFSTLGGNNRPRASRVKSEELLLLLKPIVRK